MRTPICTLIVLAVAASAGTAFAATADDYKVAEAKADAAIEQAHALHNEWTTTGAVMKAAKAAAEAGKFDEAVKHAKEAEALANGSVAQSKEQEKLWPDAVVR